MGASPNWQQLVPPKYAAVPPELTALPQWVLWKWATRPGATKPTKVPYSARSGRAASTVDPTTWTSFEEVVAASAGNGSYAGIGFVFTDDDPYVGIDLDNCIDLATGELSADAQDVVDAIDSYTERTPSGRGLHVIARGTLPPGGRKKGTVEMYEAGRYFTVTGDVWPGRRGSVEDRRTELSAFHTRVFASARTGHSARADAGPTPGASGTADEQILASIRSSNRAAKFEALFAGEWAPPTYPSQSEADLALCALLAAYCGDDAQQVDRLFRRSGLYRDKWDELRGKKTYGEKTIATALQGDAVDNGDQVPAHGGHDDKTETLTQFNRQFALVRTGNDVRILEEHRDSSGRVERVSLLTQTDFSLAVRNRKTPGGKRTEPSKWWLSHPGRREYSSIDFNPGGQKEGEYNLWQGLPIAPRAGDCGLYWQFVRDVICTGNKDLYVYLRRYMAHLIQRPGELAEVALVLRGGQGTGKNTFVEFLGALVGAYFKEVSAMEQLTGRFNAHLMQCVLLHANEAYWGGCKSDAGKLKSMITDPTIGIEQKGIDRFQVRNCIRTIVSSNDDWAVPIDPDDRRFLVLDLSELRKQDKPYFAAIRKQMNDGGLQALMHDLVQEDLEGFHPRDKPRSPYGVDMKLRSADTVTRWFYECLQDRRLHGQVIGSVGGVVVEEDVWHRGQLKFAVHDAYRNWCERLKERYPEPSSVFFKKLKKLIPGLSDRRPTADNGESRHRCIDFPDVDTMRKMFEKSISAEGLIDWPIE